MQGDDPRGTVSQPLPAHVAEFARAPPDATLRRWCSIEQYYDSPWFGEAAADLSARLIKDWVDLIETAKAQQILKDVPTPMLIDCFGGSVRETANMLRAGTLTRTDARLAMAFGLCWDGIKA